MVAVRRDGRDLGDPLPAHQGGGRRRLGPGAGLHPGRARLAAARARGDPRRAPARAPGARLLAGPGAGRGSVVPVLEVLGTALGYSIGPLIANRKLSHLPPVAVNTVCLGAAALVYAPFAALTWPTHVPSVQVLLALAALGVICTAAAFLIFF